MDISAKDVMKLRKITGAGMMDCKKALADNDGDFDKAVDFLRKKGLKTAAKRADKEANEGVLAAWISDDKRTGAMVALTCETDFVANTDDFRNFARALCQAYGENAYADGEALLAAPSTLTPGKTFRDDLDALVGKLGEKMELTHTVYRTLAEGETGVFKEYVHIDNKQGALVKLLVEKAETLEKPEFAELAMDMALQVVAYTPQAVNPEGLDPAVVEKELNIYREQARESGKPEAILDKIANGKLQKFFSEVTLLGQSFLRDEKISVQDHLKAVSKVLDDPVQVTDFVYVRIGG